MLPPLLTWIAYSAFAYIHHAVTDYFVNQGGDLTPARHLIGFYAAAGRFIKLGFLVYFAWKVGILPTLVLMATSFIATTLIWTRTPRSSEAGLSLAGLVALPLLGAWMFLSI